MNVGQIFEIYFGWVVKGLGECIGEMLDQEKKVIEVCDFLDQIYNQIGVGGIDEELGSFSEVDIMELVENLWVGVFMVIVVFDGVKEFEIKVLLELVGYDCFGQIQFWDGCSGELFDCKVIVGYMYMLKLNYFVDDKMYVCFIGLYSLVIQQLLGGKVQFGGQCFGEMEVWVFEVYGVVYMF